jgi:hypothetical protein
LSKEQIALNKELLREDKEWLAEFVIVNMKPLMLRLDEELEATKSKKIKGPPKKQKEKLGSIN